FEDHPFAGAVLHRLARIHELGLAENGAAGRFGSVLQLDERRISDGFDDVVVDSHVREIFARSVAKTGYDPRAQLPKVEAFCSRVVQRELGPVENQDSTRGLVVIQASDGTIRT